MSTCYCHGRNTHWTFPIGQPGNYEYSPKPKMHSVLKFVTEPLQLTLLFKQYCEQGPARSQNILKTRNIWGFEECSLTVTVKCGKKSLNSYQLRQVQECRHKSCQLVIVMTGGEYSHTSLSHVINHMSLITTYGFWFDPITSSPISVWRDSLEIMNIPSNLSKMHSVLTFVNRTAIAEAYSN